MNINQEQAKKRADAQRSLLLLGARYLGPKNSRTGRIAGLPTERARFVLCKEIKKAYDLGVTYKEIGKEIGVGEATISRWMLQEGYRLKKFAPRPNVRSVESPACESSEGDTLNKRLRDAWTTAVSDLKSSSVAASVWHPDINSESFKAFCRVANEAEGTGMQRQEISRLLGIQNQIVSAWMIAGGFRKLVRRGSRARPLPDESYSIEEPPTETPTPTPTPAPESLCVHIRGMKVEGDPEHVARLVKLLQ